VLALGYRRVFVGGLDSPNLLQIRQPDFTCFIMGMTDVVASSRFVSANFTNLRHDFNLLKIKNATNYHAFKVIATVFVGCP
jgi:hypothetical protein